MATENRKSLRHFRLLILSAVVLLFASLLSASAHAANLRVLKTRHYELHTDLENELAFEMANRMDVMYDEYLHRMSEFKPPANTPPLLVYLFAKKADYMERTRFMGRNSAGMFVSGPKPFLSAYLEDQGRDALRKTIQHEGFHQFAFFFISQNLPIWLNEGLAQLFEEGIWTGRAFWLGQIPPWRIRQLKADARDQKLIEFQKFMAVTPEDWIENLNASVEKGATYYNQAWAMVFFLTEGGRADYHKRFVDFVKALHNGEDADAALKQAFGTKMGAFQNDFAIWARGINPTPEATMLERQDVLGDFLSALADDGKKFREMNSFRALLMGQGMSLRYTRGNVQWQTEAPQTYFSDLNGRIYAPRSLYFSNSDGPLPDIICRPGPSIQLRTHFYKSDKKVEHEVLIENQ